jgi:Flp pilus assembly protein TadD
MLDGEMTREPRKTATIQPIAFSGLLTMATAAGEAAGVSGPTGPETPGRVARRLFASARAVAGGNADLARVEAGLGSLAVREGRMEEAARRFERAADLAPPCPSALMNLVVVRLRMGQERLARAAAKRLVAEAPASEEARAARGLLPRLEQKRRPGR